MSAFAKLFEAQKRAERKRLQFLETSHKYPSCTKRFRSKGGLAAHRKFAQPQLPAQKNKIEIDPSAPSPLEHVKSRSNFDKREEGTESEKNQEEKSEEMDTSADREDEEDEGAGDSETTDEKVERKASRVDRHNCKKLELVREFLKLRVENPVGFKEDWLLYHPGVPVCTVEGLVHPMTYKQLEADGLNANPKI